MMYFKSELTGQVYQFDTVPEFGGYTLTTEEEFNRYYIERGMNPNDFRL